MPDDTCEHHFEYRGVVYEKATSPLAGSGAYAVRYFDLYFCTKCLMHCEERLDAETNSYQPLLFDAKPKPRRGF